jgi:hypothetical protein
VVPLIESLKSKTTQWLMCGYRKKLDSSANRFAFQGF